MSDIERRLLEIAAHDWRTGHLAHTSDTAKEAAAELKAAYGLSRIKGACLESAEKDLDEVVSVLRECADQFRFYADEHTKKGNLEKAATNLKFYRLAHAFVLKAHTET